MDDERKGDNPMNHPEEQVSGTDDAPKFGRLLIVLACAVLVIVLITFASVAIYT